MFSFEFLDFNSEYNEEDVIIEEDLNNQDLYNISFPPSPSPTLDSDFFDFETITKTEKIIKSKKKAINRPSLVWTNEEDAILSNYLSKDYKN